MTSCSDKLMACHADALFLTNSDGDLTFVNDPSRETAPSVYWGIAREGSFVRYRHDVSGAIREDVAACLRTYPNAWTHHAEAMSAVSEALARHGARRSSPWSGPVFTFPADLSHFYEPVLVAPEESEILQAEFPEQAAAIESIQPCVAVIRDGKAVALCAAARRGQCVEAGVETAVAYRRMGLGTAVCATWAEHVLAMGNVPVYSTSWENSGSRALAARLGLAWVGIDVHFTILAAAHDRTSGVK